MYTDIFTQLIPPTMYEYVHMGAFLQLHDKLI